MRVTISRENRNSGISSLPTRVDGQLETEEQLAKRLICELADISACSFIERNELGNSTYCVRVAKGIVPKGTKPLSNIVGNFVVKVENER